MGDILITQFVVGPSHKQRLLHNLLTYKAYDFFDVYIMTDSVEFFAPVSDRPNIIIKDIKQIREAYPWSLEFERVPNEKFDEAAYAREYMASQFKIPTTLRRFAFLLEKQYHGYIFMDCDVIPVIDQEYFDKLHAYFTKPFSCKYGSDEGKIAVLPASSPGYDEFHHPYLIDYVRDINERYKVTDRKLKYNFITTDGNFRTLKFPDKAIIRPFFELMNNIIHDVLVEGKYFFLRGGSIWNIHSEYLMAIMLNLYESIAYPQLHEVGLHHNTGFRVDCYPEDRYWNWGQHFESSMIGKMDFVNKNYDKLKEFYQNRGQIFPY